MKQLSNDQLNKYVGGSCRRWMFAAVVAAALVAGPIGAFSGAYLGSLACYLLE